MSPLMWHVFISSDLHFVLSFWGTILKLKMYLWELSCEKMIRHNGKQNKTITDNFTNLNWNKLLCIECSVLILVTWASYYTPLAKWYLQWGPMDPAKSCPTSPRQQIRIAVTIASMKTNFDLLYGFIWTGRLLLNNLLHLRHHPLWGPPYPEDTVLIEDDGGGGGGC